MEKQHDPRKINEKLRNLTPEQPFRTRSRANALGGSGEAVELSEGLQTSMNDQTDLLSEVDYKLGQLIELIKNKHLVIDADALERSLSYRQRNRERDYGAPV